jgi:hypothetical protein
MMAALIHLIRRVPGTAWLALGCLLMAAFWLQQHDAGIRRQAQVQQLRKQTSAQVAALKKQAEQDVRQANVENAKAIQHLEERRKQIEQQNLQLSAQLIRLRAQAQTQADEVATLPISEIVARVATQLGLQADDVAPGGSPSANIAKSAKQPPGAETPHPAARAVTLSPRRGLGQTPSAALALTSSGARKVETALVELNACGAESKVQDQQMSNCQARAQADNATIARLNSSVSSLNQALAAKDNILTQQAGQYKAELRAARGTFLGRLAHVTEHVIIGVGVGLAIGVAVR